MKMRLIFLIFLTGHCLNGYSQSSTYELFTQTGLRHGIINFLSPNNFKNVSIYYSGDTIVKSLRYIGYSHYNGSDHKLWLYIDGYKVYQVGENFTYNRLLYDFGMEVGNIHKGFYGGSVVTEKGIHTYDDGKERIYYKIKAGPNSNLEIVEGIGELERSLISSFEEGGFFRLLCCSDENQTILVKEDLPGDCDTMFCKKTKAVISFQKNGVEIEFKDKSTHVVSRLWDFGDGNVSMEKNPVHIFDSPGCKEVKLTTKGECNDVSETTTSLEYCQKGGWVPGIKLPNHSIVSIYFVNDKEWIYADFRDSIHFTTDGGATYVIINLQDVISIPYNNMSVLRVRIHGDVIFVSIRGFGPGIQKYIFKSKNRGLDWEEISIGGPFGDFISDDKGNFFYVDEYFIYFSNNFAETWNIIGKPEDLTIHNAFFQNNGDILIVCTKNNLFGYSTTTIKDGKLSTIYEPAPYHVSSYRISDEIFYIVTHDHQVLKSTNMFKTFVYVTNLKILIQDPKILFISEKEWCVYSDAEVYITQNGGLSFEKQFCEYRRNLGFYKDKNDKMILLASYMNDRWIHHYFPPETSEECMPLTTEEKTTTKFGSVFPNPAFDHIYLQNADQVSSYEIFTSSGEFVKKNNSSSSGTIYIYDLPPGLYFINVNFINGTSVFEKFVKY